MQDKSKGVYVQMPKPDNNEAVKLLADLVESVSYSDRKKPASYNAAKEYLERKGIVISDKVPWLSTTASGVTKY